jgi:hypothetical protein
MPDGGRQLHGARRSRAVSVHAHKLRTDIEIKRNENSKQWSVVSKWTKFKKAQKKEIL